MSPAIAAARVGFVGVRGGLAYPQFRALSRILVDRDVPGAVTGVEVLFRAAEGWGDADLDRISRWMTPTPQLLVPNVPPGRDGQADTLSLKNWAVVDGCDVLVACPPVAVEEAKSRTWVAIRYARRIGRPVVLIYPDGTVHPGPRPYYLATDPSPVLPVAVFLSRDPRRDGHTLDVTQVWLETLPPQNRAGGTGTASARPCLGRSTAGPVRYREFESRAALGKSGYAPAGCYRVCDSWDDYRDPWHSPVAEPGSETDIPMLRPDTAETSA